MDWHNHRLQVRRWAHEYFIQRHSDQQGQIQGNDVKWLQWHLAKLGEKLKIDGSYGMLTRLAVLRFQKSRKLEPDGIVGPKTRAALKKAVK